MTVEYKGYEFSQNNGTDRYRIYDADGKTVTLDYDKPSMTVEDGMRAIERYILVSETVKAVMG